MLKILVIGYSQTGQLHKILQHFSEPLRHNPQIKLTLTTLEPEVPYPYPWKLMSFFAIFPECVFLDAPKNSHNPLLNTDYDLIILGYQPWFLSPSLPSTAFVKSEQGQKLLKNKPVITIIGCRNMWGQAHIKMQKMLKNAQARLIDNVVLIDQGSSLSTFITTPRWLLTGNQSGIFGGPKAGISKQDIQATCRFGQAINAAIEQHHDFSKNESILQGLGAVKADASLLQSEKIGARSFLIWGKLLRQLGNQHSWPRKSALILYIIFLISMIVIVVPISLLLRKLLRPFIQSKLNVLENSFEQPSGSNTNRMKDFSCKP